MPECVNCETNSEMAFPTFQLSIEFFLNEFHWMNFMNSVNGDKIQKWYGYQSYYESANRYITSAGNKKCIFITTPW